jgi:hypothetical protein
LCSLSLSLSLSLFVPTKVIAVALYFCNVYKGNIAVALLPFNKLHRRPWPEVLDLGNLTVPEMDQLIAHSYRLLTSGLQSSPMLSDAERKWLAEFCTPEFYASLFGAFDLNTQSVVIRSPLQLYWERLQQTPQQQQQQAPQANDPSLPSAKDITKVANLLQQLKVEHDNKDDDDDDDDNGNEHDENMDADDESERDSNVLFESVHGMAIFPLESLTNVSEKKKTT